MPRANNDTYTRFAIIMHWSIAFLSWNIFRRTEQSI
jgi:hypothetical protein